MLQGFIQAAKNARCRNYSAEESKKGGGRGVAKEGRTEDNSVEERGPYTTRVVTREKLNNYEKEPDASSRLERVRRPRQPLLLDQRLLLVVVLVPESRRTHTRPPRARIPLHRARLAHSRRRLARPAAAEPVERVDAERRRARRGRRDGARKVGRQGRVDRGGG